MAGAIDEDTARTLASGRETAGAMLSSAQSNLKRVFIWFLLGMLGTFFALRWYVWDFFKEQLLFARMDEITRQSTSVIAVTPFDVILLQVKLGLIVGVIVAIPSLLWYSRAALKRRGFWPAEKIPRWKLAGVAGFVLVLFAGGVFYGYQVFFPIMFSFLANNAVQAGFTPTYSIVEWTQFIFLLMISFGLAAQLPLAMSGLALSGVVRYETFRDKWRYAVVGIFVFGALFSPPDPFTQIMWALPLVALYAFSLGLTKLLVLSRRAGRQIPIRLVVREHWNVLAGTLVLAAGGTVVYLTQGGLETTNDLLATVGSSYRLPTAETFGFLGLGPVPSAAIVATFVAVVAAGVVLFYLRITELERRTSAEVLAGDAVRTAASAGGPAAIDLDELDAAGVDAAPPEVFADLAEEEAVEHAERALSEDDSAKAQAILDRYDEVHGESDDADSDEAGGETADAPAGATESGADDPITSTAAGVMDAFTEEETTEDDIGGYYYDIAFILDSLTSRAIWLVGLFLVVLAGTFIFLYTGGIEGIMDTFLAGMPPSLAEQVNIVTLHPVEALIFEIKFSTLLAAVSMIPLVLYFAWPAIEERGFATGDRRFLLVWGGSLVLALVGGSLLGFLYVAPTIISWLALDALTSNMVIAYRINNFGWLVIFTTIGIGLLAEVPVTMWLFDRGGLIPYETMRERWRVIVIGVFAAAGLFSPKGILTMFLLALPTVFALGVGYGFLAIRNFLFR